MLSLPNVLLIGSSVRKAGKTTLAASVIQHFSKEFAVVGIKISGWNHMGRDGNAQILPLQQTAGMAYQIIEAYSGSDANDTARMKEAGALKAFWLVTKQDHLIQGLTDLMTQLPSEVMILCESTSARFFILPAVFILIQHPSSITKPYYGVLQTFADRIVSSEKLGQFISEMPVRIKNGTWQIRNP